MTKETYYIVTVSCCDPETRGPYPTAEARDAEAKRMVRDDEIDPVNRDEEIFGLNIEDCKPVIFPYPGYFFEEDCDEGGPEEGDIVCPYCDTVTAPADLPSLQKDGDRTEISCEGCEAILTVERQNEKNVIIKSRPPETEK